MLLALLVVAGQAAADVKSTTGNIFMDANNNGASEAVITTTGLSIGTLTPSANLHVMGNAYVSGSTGVGVANPLSTLEISGTLGMNVQSVSSNTTLSGNSVVLAGNSSGNITLTLPSASSVTGRMYSIKKSNTSNTVTVSSSNLIDTQSSWLLGSGNLGLMKVVSNGSQWYVLSSLYAAVLPGPSLCGRLTRGAGSQTPTADFRNVETSNPVFVTSSCNSFTVGTAFSLTNVGTKGAVLFNWNGDSNAAWVPATKDQSQMASGYSYAKSSGSGWITKRDGNNNEWQWTKITAGPTTSGGTGGGITPATQTSTDSIDITVPDTTVEHTLTVTFTGIFNVDADQMKVSLTSNGTTVTYDDSVTYPGHAMYQFKFYGNCVLSVKNYSTYGTLEGWPRLQAMFID